jgi:hypothetical protein
MAVGLVYLAGSLMSAASACFPGFLMVFHSAYLAVTLMGVDLACFPGSTLMAVG